MKWIKNEQTNGTQERKGRWKISPPQLKKSGQDTPIDFVHHRGKEIFSFFKILTHLFKGDCIGRVFFLNSLGDYVYNTCVCAHICMCDFVLRLISIGFWINFNLISSSLNIETKYNRQMTDKIEFAK